MKKGYGISLSIFLVLLLIDLCHGFRNDRIVTVQKEGVRATPAIFGRMEEKEQKEEQDPHMIQLLKLISGKLEEWLKALNERIEREDVTRLEVRFLEILRNVLEWIKEKIDARIESSKGKGKGKDALNRRSLAGTYRWSFALGQG